MLHKRGMDELVYLGNIIGYRVLPDYRKIAVLLDDNIYENMLAGSIESSFLAATGGRFMNVPIVPNKIRDSIKKISGYGPEAIVILISGKKGDIAKNLLKEILQGFDSANCHADILLEAVYFDLNILGNIMKEEQSLSRFLEETNIYAFTIDIEEGIVILNDIFITPDKNVELYFLSEYPITFDHGKLLRKGPGKT